MKTFALIFIVIGTFISNDVHSLPPINFTDTVLTNRMIEALNNALTARDNQQLPPFQLLRQQLQQSFNQQQILDQQQQQQQLLDQQQQQLYPQQFVDQQKQQQQQQQFYLQQILEQQSLNQHQPVQQQYLPEQQKQQQFQQPIQQYLPEQQQFQQPIQQYLPEQQQQQQQFQQPIQQYLPEQQVQQAVQQHYLPEQQQPLPSNTDTRGYYYPYPYQNVNWYNFPSLWSAVGGGQLAATAPVAAVASGHIAPTAPVAAVGVQLNDLGTTGGCPTGFCPQGAACTQLSGQWTCGCNTNDCIGIQNPCGIYGQYYFPYYPDPSRFIQCDQTGVFWIRKCAPGTIFDPKISVCNYPPVVVETGKK